MDKNECYRILGIEKNSPDDIIKSAFKKIALKSHPDKLMNLTEEEKKEKEEIFKKSSQAYRILMGLEKEEFDYSTYDDMINKWCDPEMTSILTEMFTGMASNLMSSYINIDVKNPYSTFYNSFEPKFQTTIEISLKDYFENKVIKKYFSFNNNTFEAEIECNKYPKTSYFIEIDDIEYEIIINIEIIEDEKYQCIRKKNGLIDIIYNIGINYYHYINGTKYTFIYLNNEKIKINIEPYSLKDIKMKGKGVLGGKLIIRKNVIHPKETDIEKLTDKERQYFSLILKKIYK